ncbi:MAG: hypothetical protein HON65_00380 [Rhodospirillales bacterium]|jgi:hypothetical protein|nr:hypothetical protein [Rhodospirillales bacterium]
MNQITPQKVSTDHERYARCIDISKRIRWDIDQDVLRGRSFDTTQKFLPDGLSKVNELSFLSEDEQRFLSQVQGRTYANTFGLVERFINAKVLEISQDHWLGDQIKLEALIRFSDEELKHQELFRRVDRMLGDVLPTGYSFKPEPDPVAEVVLGKSTWAVLGLTLLIELFTQSHYTASIGPDVDISPLFKDIFKFHWQEESQHAALDALEWQRINADMSDADRDKAVDELIELAAAVDGILQAQSISDAEYFEAANGRSFDAEELNQIREGLLAAYRWQYIFSGTEHPRFLEVLGGMINEDQGNRIFAALATLS